MIEEMRQLFDQSRAQRDKHYLTIDEADIPLDYRPLLRRLQQAAAEPEIADAMELEDEILEELQDIERQLEQAQERADAAQERADAAQERADAAQERAEAEQARAEAAQERAEAERAEKERLLELLKAAGIDPNGTASNR